MKKTLLGIIAGFLFLSLNVSAQTNTNTAPGNLWDFVTTGTNYFAVPFTTYSVNDHSFGGGIALGYRITEIVAPVIRLDYFNSKLYNVSLTANLQPPRSLFGKFPVTPFVIAGAATPISGGGEDNGTFVSVVGGGLIAHFDTLGSSWLAKHAWLAADYEKWIGLPQRQEDQIRFGFGLSF